MITATIDGRQVTVAEGTNIVEAALKVGIEIPTYCYHPGLTVVGQCRICFVEVEGMPRLVTACSTPYARLRCMVGTRKTLPCLRMSGSGNVPGTIHRLVKAWTMR